MVFLGKESMYTMFCQSDTFGEVFLQIGCIKYLVTLSFHVKHGFVKIYFSFKNKDKQQYSYSSLFTAAELTVYPSHLVGFSNYSSISCLPICFV